MNLLLIVAALLLPPCPTEDSVGCYWDASASGNGAGTSFVALTEDLIIPINPG